MKIYSKLLAISAIAFRLFCLNSYADPIVWENISHFFNFDTIEAEKRTDLETNIRLLVKEQLKLSSGQNLWKAFQFWKEQHRELGFQFEFALMGSAGAHIELKKYEDWSQTFRFEITCNEIFAENHRIPHWHKISRDLESNLALKQFLNINMLYRPCLIKLVNPDDLKNWNYHLREQELPFFITLAHEFLHALNQLECAAWLMKRNEDFSNPKSRIQEFLMEKLELKPDDDSLQEKYKKLWENKDYDDSLDEMTVILGRERQIGDSLSPFIGESTFLREYYKNDSIISWSHYSANDIDLWENSEILLNTIYIDNMQKTFSLIKEIQEINYENIKYERISYHTSFHPKYMEKEKDLFNTWLENTIQSIPRNKAITKMIMQLHSRVSEFVLLPNIKFSNLTTDNFKTIKFLPKKLAKTNNLKKDFNFHNYVIQDNACDGNSVFLAIDNAIKDINGIKISNNETVAPPPLPNSKFISIPNAFRLRRKIKEYGTNYGFNENFLGLLSQDKFWDDGINGDVGLKILGLIAKIIEEPILIIIQVPDKQLQYCLFETINNIGDLKKSQITCDKLEEVLNNHPNAIKLYYNGYYYRAIVRKN